MDLRFALEVGGGAKKDDSLGCEAGVGFADLLRFAEPFDLEEDIPVPLSSAVMSMRDVLEGFGREGSPSAPVIVLNAARAIPKGDVVGSGFAEIGGAVDGSGNSASTSSVGVGIGDGDGEAFFGPPKKLFSEVCLPENSS